MSGQFDPRYGVTLPLHCDDCQCGEVADRNGSIVARVEGTVDSSDGQVRALQRLFAAAPKLEAAVRAFVEADDAHNVERLIDAAAAARRALALLDEPQQQENGWADLDNHTIGLRP